MPISVIFDYIATIYIAFCVVQFKTHMLFNTLLYDIIITHMIHCTLLNLSYNMSVAISDEYNEFFTFRQMSQYKFNREKLVCLCIHEMVNALYSIRAPVSSMSKISEGDQSKMYKYMYRHCH